MINFIFFMTYEDVTIPNAFEVLEEVKDTGVVNIGFKDVGLSYDRLRDLAEVLKGEGKTTFLEVVSGTREENLRSAKIAVELGVDYLIGGTHIEPTLQIIRDAKIKYFPYVGEVVGHPCLLRGSIENVVNHAEKAEALGVDGINLLGYRYDGDVGRLISSVKNALSIPLIVAGSIDSFERIRTVKKLGVWGFTIGSAIFDRKFMPQGSISDQIIAVLKEIE